MKSIEKLRELSTFGTVKVDSDLTTTNMLMVCATKQEINEIADEIEAEADRDYMKLPRLDDGVINVGDWIESDYEEIKCVREVEALIWDGERWDFQLSDEDGDTRDCASIYEFYEKSKHVAKPDPLKELLAEMAGEVWEASCTCQTTWSDSGLDGIEEHYAKRVRELMEEGGDD